MTAEEGNPRGMRTLASVAVPTQPKHIFLTHSFCHAARSHIVPRSLRAPTGRREERDFRSALSGGPCFNELCFARGFGPHAWETLLLPTGYTVTLHPSLDEELSSIERMSGIDVPQSRLSWLHGPSVSTRIVLDASQKGNGPGSMGKAFAEVFKPCRSSLPCCGLQQRARWTKPKSRQLQRLALLAALSFHTRG